MPLVNSSSLLFHVRGNICVVELIDTAILSQNQVEQITSGLKTVLDEGYRKVILDFTNVQHISSALLGALLSSNTQIQKASGELRLAAINDELAEIFALTRLDKKLKLYRSVDHAAVKF